MEVHNDVPVTPDYTPPDLNLAEALPPEFRDKPYFKDKTFVDVIKEHANLQSLMGQRPAGIPKEDAPDEEWDKYLGALRPKDENEYAFPETDFSKAGKRNEGYETALRKIASEVGVPKRQFSKFVSMVEGHLAAADTLGEQQTAEQQAARDQEFEALLDKTYAKDKQTVIDRTKKLMAEAIDPALKDKLADVLKDASNDTLFVLTAVLDGVYKKHIAEDGSPGGGENAGVDAGSLRAEAEKIMGSPVYNNFRIPGHEEARQKVKDIFKRIADMGVKK